MKNKGPKILTIDIETKPIEAYVWGLYDQNIAVSQIKHDWEIISVAWKWFDDDLVTQFGRNDYTEFQILKLIRKALNEADIVVTQNGKQFDIKKIIAKKIKPASSFQQIDTKVLAKKHFGFTSNGLEYMSDKLNKKYKKLKHKDFPGMELWLQCLKKNPKAWAAMREYNIFDVLATEELYTKLLPFGVGINFDTYYPDESTVCPCGGTKFKKNGFKHLANSKYQRYSCIECGYEKRHWKNLAKKGLR